MADNKIPFGFTATGGGAFESGPVPGRAYMLQGMVLTTSAYTSVSGIGSIQLNNVVQPFSGASAQPVEFFFNPSTSQGLSVPLFFGTPGIVFMVNQALSLNIQQGGSVPDFSLTMWGVTGILE